MLRITLVRHATLLVELADRTLLIDPMLDDAEAQPPVPGTFNPQRYPLVPLPTTAAEVVSKADATLLTHRHVDHFDGTAIGALREADRPVLCQPEDEEPLRELGFADVRPVADTLVWGDIRISRTGCSHGTGEMAEVMAPVSGYVLAAGGHRLYIAGDTVWCDEVGRALDEHDPTVVVVNSGEARMMEGDPITMDAEDVVKVARRSRGEVLAVHLEALNHCVLSRAELDAHARSAGVSVRIPADGESLTYASG